MPIKVHHGVGAGAFAAAAFGGAQGKERAELKKKELAAMEARREAAASREFQARQAELGREHQTERDIFGAETQAARDAAQAETQAERDEILAGYQRERDVFRSDLEQQMEQAERDRVAGQVGLPEGYDAKYYEMAPDEAAMDKAQEEARRVEEAIASGELEPEQAEEARQRAQEAVRQAGTPVPQRKGPSPSELLKEKTIPVGGNLYPVNRHGEIGKEPLVDRPEREQDPMEASSKRLNILKQIDDQATNPVTGEIDKTKKDALIQQLSPELREQLFPQEKQAAGGGDPVVQKHLDAGYSQQQAELLATRARHGRSQRRGGAPAEAQAQPEQVAFDTAEVGMPKPPGVTADPEKNQQWDIVGQQMQATQRQIEAVQGDASGEVDATAPVEEIADVATARKRLDMVEAEEKQWREDHPRGKWMPAEDRQRMHVLLEQKRTLRSRVDELSKQADMLKAHQELKSQLLRRLGRG